MKKCNSIKEFNDYLTAHAPATRISAKGNVGTDHYYLTVGAFDTETTECLATDENGKEIKINYVYAWSFSLGGELFMWGRDPQEFVTFINELKLKHTLIIFDHWLGYEYCNLRDIFDTYIANPEEIKDDDIGFIKGDDYRIYKLKGNQGKFKKVQFRCSSAMSGGRKLAELGEDIGCNKLELDYKKPRNRETPMTDEEIEYCLRDVEIVCKWVLKTFNILEVDKFNLLPKTMSQSYDVALEKHGLTRNARFGIAKQKYINWDTEDDERFKEAYRGGEITCNKEFLGKHTKNILYADIKSAYPAVMLTKKVPRCFIKAKKQLWEQKMMLEEYENYAVVAKFTFTNLCLKPQAPCSILRDKTTGKDITALLVFTSYFTNVELQNIKKFYNFSSLVWEDFQWSQYELMDYRERETLTDLFIEKEEAKGTPEEDFKKRRLNCSYGIQSRRFKMKVRKYDKETKQWVKEEQVTAVEDRERYYPVGVWIAAWQRKIMLDIIWELSDDFIYSNTDSIICLDNERNRQIIEDYNNSVVPIGKDEAYARLGKFEMEHFHEVFIVGVSKYILKNEKGEIVKRIFSGISAEVTEKDLENYAAGAGFVIKDAMPHYNSFSGVFKGIINGKPIEAKSTLVITYSDYAPTPDEAMKQVCFIEEIY